MLCVFGRNFLIWKSKRQTVCTKSSAEVKYRVMVMGVSELLWLKILLEDLRMIIDEHMCLYCDNKATINLANNLVLHDRTKHIEMYRNFIRENLTLRS